MMMGSIPARIGATTESKTSRRRAGLVAGRMPRRQAGIIATRMRKAR